MFSCKIFCTRDGSSVTLDSLNASALCSKLEDGGIIYFPISPFALEESQNKFLISQQQVNSGYFKNIAYRPVSQKLTGFKSKNKQDMDRLRQALAQYSLHVTEFLEKHLTPYSNQWHHDYASFRPLEEETRKIRLRARNDLLHVDSFPTRPTGGRRILRVFTNIHPKKERVWQTSDPFDVLAGHFKHQLRSPINGTFSQKLFPWKKRSPYDTWMLKFHHFLKENIDFQHNTRKNTWSFPPGSGWMVYTDMVSHSVVSGQYALEKTFIINKNAQVTPEKAPIDILKSLYNLSTKDLTHHN
jgi:hypothetical protein